MTATLQHAAAYVKARRQGDPATAARILTAVGGRMARIASCTCPATRGERCPVHGDGPAGPARP